MVEERPMEEEQSEGGVDLSKRMQVLQEFAGEQGPRVNFEGQHTGHL